MSPETALHLIGIDRHVRLGQIAAFPRLHGTCAQASHDQQHPKRYLSFLFVHIHLLIRTATTPIPCSTRVKIHIAKSLVVRHRDPIGNRYNRYAPAATIRTEHYDPQSYRRERAH